MDLFTSSSLLGVIVAKGDFIPAGQKELMMDKRGPSSKDNPLLAPEHELLPPHCSIDWMFLSQKLATDEMSGFMPLAYLS